MTSQRRNFLRQLAAALLVTPGVAAAKQNQAVQTQAGAGGKTILGALRPEPSSEVEWLINAETERLSKIKLVSIEAFLEGREDRSPSLRFSNAKAKAFATEFCLESKKNGCPDGIYEERGDCTHFISHVLAAGGVVLDGPIHTCRKGFATVVVELHSAFINASEIYSNVRVRKSNLAEPGDYVFILENLSARNDHAMLLNGPITGNGANVFGHTNQRCNERATFDPAKCVFYKISDHA